RLDTVATGIAQSALGPDGTLYAVDTLRRVISLSRRTRFAWPQALTALPRDLFGAPDQHLVGVIPQDRLLVAAADQPPTVRPIAAGGDVAATRWGDLVAVASDSGVTFYDPLGRRDPAFVRLSDAPRALAFSPSGHRIYVARRNMPGLAVVDRYERKELDGVALPGPVAALRLALAREVDQAALRRRVAGFRDLPDADQPPDRRHVHDHATRFGCDHGLR